MSMSIPTPLQIGLTLGGAKISPVWAFGGKNTPGWQDSTFTIIGDYDKITEYVTEAFNNQAMPLNIKIRDVFDHSNSYKPSTITASSSTWQTFNGNYIIFAITPVLSKLTKTGSTQVWQEIGVIAIEDKWIDNDYRLIAASQSNLSTSIEGFRNRLNKSKSESDYPAYGSLSKYDILKNPETKAFTITIHGKLNSTNMVVTNPTEIIPKGGRDLLTQLYSEMESDMSKKISRSNYDIGLPTKKSVSIPAIPKVTPMLAKDFSKGHGKRIVYPALTQRKFDGVRCLCHVYLDDNGELITKFMSRRAVEYSWLSGTYDSQNVWQPSKSDISATIKNIFSGLFLNSTKLLSFKEFQRRNKLAKGTPVYTIDNEDELQVVNGNLPTNDLEIALAEKSYTDYIQIDDTFWRSAFSTNLEYVGDEPWFESQPTNKVKDSKRLRMMKQILKDGIYLDGELYSHQLEFDRISGLCRKKTFDEKDQKDISKLQYRMYDFFYAPTEETYELFYKFSDKKDEVMKNFNALCMDKVGYQAAYTDRYGVLASLYQAYVFSLIDDADPITDKSELKKLSEFDAGLPVNLTQNILVNSENDLEKIHDTFVDEGYEGLMIRNLKMPYDFSRSWNLIKYKKMKDSEFSIVGAKQGTGNAAGAIIWTCETADKKHTFEVVPLGTIDSRKKLWNEWNLTPTKFIGKPLTVQYQELTPKGIPRFPKGISIRDYE